MARSILVIVWHLINNPEAVYQDIGSDWHQRQANPARKTRDLVRELERLGHQVTLTPPPPTPQPERTWGTAEIRVKGAMS